MQDFREYFFDMVIIDGLINNNDRNKENFGLLFKNGEYKLAPVFDNGSAFYSKTSDEQIKKGLNDNNTLEQSFLDNIKFRDILNFDNEDIETAIIRLTPIIREKMPDIKDFIASIPEEFAGYKIISKERKEYYYKSMEERLNKLIIPKYNTLKNLPK